MIKVRERVSGLFSVLVSVQVIFFVPSDKTAVPWHGSREKRLKLLSKETFGHAVALKSEKHTKILLFAVFFTNYTQVRSSMKLAVLNRVCRTGC